MPGFSTISPVRSLVIIAFLSCAITSAVQAENPADRRLAVYHRQEAQLREKFEETLTRIASDCRRRNQEDGLRQIASLLEQDPAQDLSARKLPEEVTPPLPQGLLPSEREWRTRLREARVAHAKDLHILARRAMTAGLAGYALQLIHRVTVLDPDHAQAREMLGYTRQGDRWVTPFTLQKIQRREVWTDRFGWLLATHVERYEKGERFYRGRWMSAEREAEIRRDFRYAWEVRTEHFRVKTNVSLEKAAEIAGALETYHRFFLQVFAGFFQTDSQIQRMFTTGRTRMLPQKPHIVHYYASKDEYVKMLRDKIPQIAITNGLYFTGDRTAHFFHDPEQVTMETIYHEATHQIFYESSPADREIATSENFWVIEGIACYMETFRDRDGVLSVGDPTSLRMEAARYRLLNDRYYVPLGKFTQMSMREFQTSQEIHRNYSQAAGLVHFFMHYDNGVYRDALIDHLSDLYRQSPRRPRPIEPLDRRTGVAFTTLDRQYVEYMRNQQQKLREPVLPPNGP